MFNTDVVGCPHFSNGKEERFGNILDWSGTSHWMITSRFNVFFIGYRKHWPYKMKTITLIQNHLLFAFITIKGRTSTLYSQINYASTIKSSYCSFKAMVSAGLTKPEWFFILFLWRNYLIFVLLINGHREQLQPYAKGVDIT